MESPRRTGAAQYRRAVASGRRTRVLRARWLAAGLAAVGLVIGLALPMLFPSASAGPPWNAWAGVDTGGAGGGDDAVTLVDVPNPDTVTNETLLGVGTGTTELRGLGVQPSTSVLFGTTTDRLGTISQTTGEFTAVGGFYGSVDGSVGVIVLDSVQGIAFDPSSGDLYGIHNRAANDVTDLLFVIDPITGSPEFGWFGGADYIEIAPDDNKKTNSFDVAFDPTDGVMYALAADSDGPGPHRLGVLNPSTGSLVLFGGKSDAVRPKGLAFDKTGQAWLVGSPAAGGELWSLDKTNGELISGITLDDAGAYVALAFFPNQAPTFDQDLTDRTDSVGDVISLPSPATDPDGDALTYSATGLPPGLSIDSGSGLISGTVGYLTPSGSPWAVEIKVEDPAGSFDVDTFAWTTGPSSGMLLSTGKDVNSPSGVPGLDSWLKGTVLVFGDPGLAWEPAGTTGTFDLAVALESFGAGDTNGVHLVERPVTVGSSPSMDLLPGDLLFTLVGDDNLTSTNSISAKKEDIVVFRPDAPGDYSAGTFATVLQNPAGAEIRGFTLVEATTDVGDVPVPAGSFLLTQSGGSEHYHVYLYVPTGTGAGTTTGVQSILLSSAETGIDQKIWGLDLMEEDQGGVLTAGSILVTQDASDQVGTADDVSTAPEDVFALHAAGSGPAVVTAEVVFFGSEVGLNDPVDAIGFLAGNRPPTFDQDLLDRVSAEGDLIALPSPATDPDGDTLAYTGIGLPPGLSIDLNTGLISGTVSAGATAGSPYAVTIRVEDPSLAFDTDTFSWTVMVGSTAFRDGSDGYAGTEDTMLAEALASTFYGNAPSIRVDLSAGGFGGGETQGLVQFGGIVGTGPGQIPAGSTINSATLQVWVNDGGEGTISLHRMLQPWNEASTWNSLVGGIQTDGVEAAVGFETQHFNTAAMGSQSISGLEVSVQAWVNGADNHGWALFSDSMIGWEFDSSESGTVDRRPRLIVDYIANQSPVFDQNLGDRSDVEGTVISLASSATDPEGHGITYSATDLPPGLSIDSGTGLISGTITFVAAAGSPYGVQVTATDDFGAVSVDTFTWTVTNLNRPPVVVNPGDRSNSETDPVTFGVSGSDPDGDGLTWTTTGLPDGLSIDPLTGVISGTISYDGATGSPHAVTVRATDDGAPNLFDEVAFTWTVANVNRGPNVNHPGHQTVTEGEVISLFVTATDPDGDNFTWSAVGLPDGLSIDPVTGEVSGTVGFGESASSPFNSTITATDDGVPQASGAALVDWTVSDTNRAPVAADPGAQVSDENDPVNLPMIGSDPDGDGLVWSAVGLPTGLSINPGSGLISGIMDYSASVGSPYAVTVTLTDDGIPVMSGQAAFSWTVNDVNRAPVVTNPGDQADAEGDTILLAVVGSDPDGDGLTWSAVGLPPGLSISPITGVISGTLTYTSSGIFPVSVRATDDGIGNLFDEVTFTWTVADTNRPPVVDDPGPQVSGEGDSQSLLMTAADPELDGFTWSATGLPDGLAIDPVTGVISGDIGYGSASGSPFAVTITATDDGVPAEAGNAVFTWTVTDINRGPLVTDPGPQANRSGDLVSLTMTAVDSDGDGFTWSAIGLPFGLSIDPISGEISGFAGANGLYLVTVTATDDGSPSALTDVQFVWAIADDLAIAKVSDAGGAAAMGQAIGYTITVDNPGPATHTGVTVTDPLPAGTSWVSTQVTYPVDGLAGTASDNWDTWDYTGSTGTIPWSTDWIETGDDGDPNSGKIHIHQHDGRRLIELEQGDMWITRTVDLSGYASATLSYEFRRHKLDDSGDIIVVEVSADGAAWTEVARHSGPGDDDWQVKAPIDLSDYVSATTMIRFRSLTTHGDGELRVSWVEISATERVPATAAGGPLPNLASGVTLLPGESMTVELTVQVDDPLDRAIISIDNTATVTGDLQVLPAGDSASDLVNHGPLFDQDRTDRTDAEDDTVTFGNPATDPNGDVLAWSVVGLPPGVLIDPFTGTVSGTITFDAAAASPYTVIVRVEDPAGEFHEDTFLWMVADTNRPPVVVDPGAQFDAEADAVSLAVAGSDPDGNGLTWSATGLPDGLSIDPLSGVISGTIGYDAAAASPYVVTVRATDDGAPSLFHESVFNWTVANTNRSPVVVDPGLQSGAEGDVVSLAVGGSDPDGNGLTWSATALPDGLSIDPLSGVISGTIGYDAAAVSPFVVTLRATDDGIPNLFHEVTFTWDVSDTNRAPSVTDPGDQASDEGEIVSLEIVGTDPDLDTLNWTANSLPPGLVINSTSGIVSGTITFDATGSYTVTIRATDDRSPVLFDEVVITWDVTDTNRAPSIVDPGTRTSAEADVVSLAVIGSDPDDDGLTWSVTGLPDGLAMDPGTGVVSGTITHDASPASPYTVTVTLTDDGTPSLSDEVVFTWTVVDTNRPPVIVSPGDRASGETDPISLPIPASDPDEDELTWSASGLPDGLAIDPGTGVISGTISFDAAAGSPYAVTITVDDDGSPVLTDRAAFDWLVTNTNRAPEMEAVADQASREADVVSLLIPASDPDDDELTWSATGLPYGLAIDPGTGVVSGTITYEAAEASPYATMVTATDDGDPSLWTTVVFTWDVADVNRAPAIVAIEDQASSEGETVELLLEASDPDDDGLTWSATGLPSGLAIDPASGIVSGTVTYDASPGSPYTVTVKATDDREPNLTVEEAFLWTVSDTNRAPVVVDPGDQTDGEDDPVSVSVSGSDPDGDAITWSAEGLPPGTSIDPITGRIHGTFTVSGTFSVTATATDDGSPSLAASVGFVWTVVAAEPLAPIIEPLENRTDLVGDEITIEPVAVSPDGEPLVWSATGLPPGVTIDAASGIISGTVTVAGTFEVNVVVSDPRDLSATAGFVWTVGEGLPEDEPPRAEDDAVEIVETELDDGQIVIGVLGNDADPEGTPLRIIEIGRVPVGSVEINGDGTISYRPPNGWFGATSFVYVVADEAGNTDTARVTVTIGPDIGVSGAAASLVWTPPEEARPTAVIGTLQSAEPLLVLGTIFQSLSVLRMPLTLLGGAVLWSLLLGGAFNLTLLLRHGVPFLSRRASIPLAVVLASHGQRVPAHAEPGEGEVVHRFVATDQGILGTGSISTVGDVEWAEVETPGGRGWVETLHLTEQVDLQTFTDDPAPRRLLKRFVEVLQDKGDLTDLISRHGLWVSHHADPVHYPPVSLATLMTATTTRVWRGRNPAYPDTEGSFAQVVGAGWLAAWDHPDRVLTTEGPAVPSTVLPVEFTNFHSISISADLRGRDRLDQEAWLAFFSYEGDAPYLVALVKEG